MANFHVVDSLLHNKTGSGEEVITLPYTKYDNLFGAPRAVNDISSFPGAPFFFYETDTVTVDDTTVEEMLGIDLTLN